MAQTGSLKRTVAFEKGVSASKDGDFIVLKGAKGEVRRNFASAAVAVEVENGEVIITAPRDSRLYRRQANTYIAHLKNMQKGVLEGHVYQMRICSGHFPMNVAATKADLTIKNFLGERVPRSMKLPAGVAVKVNGKDLEVTSSDKELAGRVASRIELLTRRSNYDKRVFQDGIYIISKDGKEIR